MLPMRSVPHRVVCLLGVDDGVFPRRPPSDGDNITNDEEWIADRDVRSEDRQLLLDAIMSARERLVVIFAGADPRSGAEIPPAVPIGELLDALDSTARTEDGEAILPRSSPGIRCSHSTRPTSPLLRSVAAIGSASIAPACGPPAPRRESGAPRWRSSAVNRCQSLMIMGWLA
jgi:exodeoxyribonuclease V gamma subunit